MKTKDLKELLPLPLEKVTLPTAAMPGRMDNLGRSMKRAPRRNLGVLMSGIQSVRDWIDDLPIFGAASVDPLDLDYQAITYES